MLNKFKKNIFVVSFCATILISLYAAWGVYSIKQQLSSLDIVQNQQNAKVNNNPEANADEYVDYKKQAFGFNGFVIRMDDLFDQKTGNAFKKIEIKGSWVYDQQNISFSKDDGSLATIIVNSATKIFKVTPGKNGAHVAMKKISLSEFKDIPENYGVSIEFAGNATKASGGGIARIVRLLPLPN